MSGCEEAEQILRKEIQDAMNRRQLKKAMKKKTAAAIVNQNTFLMGENRALKRRIRILEEKEAAIARSYEANVGAMARLYGERIEGYSILDVPLEEVDRTKLDYEVKCSIEDGRYIVCVLPRVDPEAE